MHTMQDVAKTTTGCALVKLQFVRQEVPPDEIVAEPATGPSEEQRHRAEQKELPQKLWAPVLDQQHLNEQGTGGESSCQISSTVGKLKSEGELVDTSMSMLWDQKPRPATVLAQVFGNLDAAIAKMQQHDGMPDEQPHGHEAGHPDLDEKL